MRGCNAKLAGGCGFKLDKWKGSRESGLSNRCRRRAAVTEGAGRVTEGDERKLDKVSFGTDRRKGEKTKRKNAKTQEAKGKRAEKLLPRHALPV